MARPWRIQFENAIYHITSRGNNQQTIFLNNNDKNKFLELIGRASARFDLEIFAFCLMDNHYHLFLRTLKGNLSKSMQWLNGTYTGYFNWRHSRSGHLLQGRYRSVLVLDERHWLHLSMYLHLNPVRAGMIDDPARYFWSSYLDYTRLSPRFGWLRREEILSQYGSGKAARIRNYRKECLTLLGKTPGFLEQLKNEIILGPREAIEDLLKKYQPSGKVKAVTDYTMTMKTKIDPFEEIQRVAQVLNIEADTLLERRRNFPAKLIAYFHLVENCGLSVTDTANFLKVSPMAVSLGITRLTKCLLKEKDLQRKIKKLSLK